MVTAFKKQSEEGNLYSRRTFIAGTGGAMMGSTIFGCSMQKGWSLVGTGSGHDDKEKFVPTGPGAKYQPLIKVAFVRRKEPYGMYWPGAIYDGKAALEKYSRAIIKTAKELSVEVKMRVQPIYSIEEAEAWLAEAQSEKPDGLVVVTLDRQRHTWPTVTKAIESGIPTVVFSPVGTSFTTNTGPVAHRQGAFICSTDDFSQTAYGMKMLKAGAKLREMRYVVIYGDKRIERPMDHFGTKFRYIPAREFMEEYDRLPIDDEIQQIATEYMRRARKIQGPTRQDVLNGVKSYIVARNIMKQEEADGITMDCLGAIGPTKKSLPCIAWSRMMDHGIPAACEADRGACISQALVQLLFDRPGFQQDPVADTSRACLIGAHCSCPTRLNGFSQPSEPFDITHHHGKRDAVPRTIWKVGQQVTVMDILPGKDANQPPSMIISAGRVVDNISVPPSGGCVVSVSVKLDGVTELLDYPGFHQQFFYGDHKKQLKWYCQLFSIKGVVI